MLKQHIGYQSNQGVLGVLSGEETEGVLLRPWIHGSSRCQDGELFPVRMEITVVDFGILGNYRTWSGLSIRENFILRKFLPLERGREFSRHQVTPPTILLCYTVHYFVFYKNVPYLASELIRLHQVWLHIREALVTVYLKCLSPSMRTLTFASIFFLIMVF